jgi:4-amino-4-deoxy-L-arabinose transferase-like glycosyltransferase
MVDTRVKYGAGLLLVLLIVVNLFYHVASTPLAEWDEARHIASAVEMVRSHDYLINTYQGQPDYWNAKPPLSMWGAAAGYRLVENPFWGVRLFSTLSVLAILFMVYRFARGQAGPLAGILAALMLLTSASFIYRHGARTADPDMLFVAMTTAALLFFSRGTQVFIGLGYVFLGLAFLAKSFHAAPYAIAVFAWTLWLWRQGLLSLRALLLLPFCFFIPVLPWALARYFADGTQFFQMMVFNDLIKRTAQDIIDNHGPTTPLMYLPKLLAAFAIPFVCAVMALRRTWPVAMWRQPARVLLLGWVGIPLLLYSAAQTRLPWYAFPLFPAISILLAMLLLEAGAQLPRSMQHRMMVALVLGLLVNEGVIVQRIHAAHQKDPVAVALLQLAPKVEGRLVTVFLEPDAAQWRQHYYASALLLGRATLAHGGEKAFATAPLSVNPVLIRWDGEVVWRKPQLAMADALRPGGYPPESVRPALR